MDFFLNQRKTQDTWLWVLPAERKTLKGWLFEHYFKVSWEQYTKLFEIVKSQNGQLCLVSHLTSELRKLFPATESNTKENPCLPGPLGPNCNAQEEKINLTVSHSRSHLVELESILLKPKGSAIFFFFICRLLFLKEI